MGTPMLKKSQKGKGEMCLSSMMKTNRNKFVFQLNPGTNDNTFLLSLMVRQNKLVRLSLSSFA